VSETGTNTDFVPCWVGDCSAVPGFSEEIGRFYQGPSPQPDTPPFPRFLFTMMSSSKQGADCEAWKLIKFATMFTQATKENQVAKIVGAEGSKYWGQFV
jgi:hypothetical protein